MLAQISRTNGQVLELPIKLLLQLLIKEYKLDQIHLAKFWPYLKNVLPAAFHDIWISLGSDFSGNLRGNLYSAGRLKYSTAVTEKKPVLKRMGSSTSGAIDYSFVLNKDSIKVQEFKLRSGPINFSAIGKLSGFKSQDPKVSFDFQTSEFEVGRALQYFPVRFLPESIHGSLNQRLRNGSLEIKSLKFEGSLEQLKQLDSRENKNLFVAEIILKQVDWFSPLPSIKKVIGSFQYKNGNGFFKINKARFKGLPIENLNGVVRSMMNNPVVDLSLDNEIQMIFPYNNTID